MIVHGNLTIKISDFQKSALTKLARMSRVIHNAKSIARKQVQFVENFNEIV
jgi:hypothetical protein